MEDDGPEDTERRCPREERVKRVSIEKEKLKRKRRGAEMARADS